MERALEWLAENESDALKADSWEEFCKSKGPLGEHYMKYRWLARHWEFLKERGFMLMNTVVYPKARAFTDLFESAKIVKQVVTKGHGSSYAAPAGMFYISEPTIAGHYGGRRSLDPTRTYGDGTPIRQHFGATWHVCYVKPRVDIPTFPSGRHFAMEQGSFEAIKRDDGVLIVCNAKGGIGSTWVALLDEGDSLESLLSPEDQAFLANERAAEALAFGTEVAK